MVLPHVIDVTSPTTDKSTFICLINSNLTQINTLTVQLDSTYIDGNLILQKKNGMVQVMLPNLKDNIPLSTYLSVGTISNLDYAPITTVFKQIGTPNDSPRFRIGISNTGNVQIYRYSGTVGSGADLNTMQTLVYVCQGE